MKKLITIALALLCLSAYSQNAEYITDSGLESSNIVVTEKNSSWPAKGVWFSYWGSNKNATIETIDDEDAGKVIETISYTGYKQIDYDPWFGQRILNVPSAGIYRLSFKAKSTNRCVDPRIAVSLRLKGTYKYKERQAFKRLDFVYDPANKELGGTALIDLTSDWDEYFVDFDLTKVVSSLTEPAWDVSQGREYKILDAMDADRQDFYLTIQSFEVAADFVVDDVSLKLSTLSTTGNTITQQMQIEVENKQISIYNITPGNKLYLIDPLGHVLDLKHSQNNPVQFNVVDAGVYIVYNATLNIHEKVLVY